LRCDMPSAARCVVALIWLFLPRIGPFVTRTALFSCLFAFRDMGHLAIRFPPIFQFMEFSVRLAREFADYFAVQHEAGA
ncbi:MAG: hypothetical protein Q8L61_00295, partial [Hyphomicrobium sp.]|nr:hypothetical protein [Hyphomicrobium sp.]